MKIYIMSIVLLLYPHVAKAIEVRLAWDANTESDLSNYTLYQADKFEDKTGPWSAVQTIDKDQIFVIITVEDGKNFAWYLTATDDSGNVSQASNMVELYDKVSPLVPFNFRKE